MACPCFACFSWYRDIESRDKPLTAYDHVRLEDSRPFPDTLLNDTSVPPNVLHAQRYRAIRAYYNGYPLHS